MAWFAVQSLAMIVVAFAAGLAVGWLLRGRRSRPESPSSPDDLVGTSTSPVPVGAILATAIPSGPASGPAVDREFWTPSTTGQPAVVTAHPDVVAEYPVSETEQPMVENDDSRADTEAEVVAEVVEPQAEVQPPPGESVEPVQSVQSVEPVESGELPEPAETEAEPVLLDDLTMIDGVSERMARALATEGLGSFFAIANASEDALRRALRVNRIRSAPGISFWAARAAELMAEDQGETHPAAKTTDPPAPTTDPSAELAPADEAYETDAEAPAPVEEEPSPLAAAMAALDAAQPPATQVAETTQPPPMTPAPRTGSAFRTAAHAPGVPSWTTITPASSDDLGRIIGVTPAIIDTLHEAGVTNYTQLAAVRDEELRQILADAQLELPRELPTWSVQAALLLQGDAESAATLAGGLMVGRENS